MVIVAISTTGDPYFLSTATAHRLFHFKIDPVPVCGTRSYEKPHSANWDQLNCFKAV